MRAHMADKQFDWPAEITTLAGERGMSLRELATALGVSHVFLSKVVRGEKPASSRLKIKLWSCKSYGLSRERMLELLMPDDIAAEFREFEREQGPTTVNQPSALETAASKASNASHGAGNGR